MPVKTTYPNIFVGSGKVHSDLGYQIEVHQGYCVVGSTPVTSYNLLDIDSPNPAAPNNLVLLATPTAPRQIMGIRGIVLGNNIILGSSGLLKIGSSISGDGSQSANNNMTAVTRNGATGADITANTIPVNTAIHNGGSPATMFAATSSITGNMTMLVMGATVAANTASTLNMSAIGRPAAVLVTVTSMVRKPTVPTVSDYPELPKNVRELLTVIQ